MRKRTTWIVSILAVVATGTLGITLAHPNKGNPPNARISSPIKQTATKVSTQPSLDNELLQPATPKMIAELALATVEDANGRAVPIATDKPTIFFAYWCGHCHEAISQLESLGFANKFDYVSSLLE